MVKSSTILISVALDCKSSIYININMSKILKLSILNKLKKTNASLISINTFTKKIDEIITRKYKMKEQLTIIHYPYSC